MEPNLVGSFPELYVDFLSYCEIDSLTSNNRMIIIVELCLYCTRLLAV